MDKELEDNYLKIIQSFNAEHILLNAQNMALKDVVRRLYDRLEFAPDDFEADYNHCFYIRCQAIPEDALKMMPDRIASLLNKRQPGS